MAFAFYAMVEADHVVHFEAEFRALRNGESINPKNPFMENGVISVGGRLIHSMTEVPFTGVRPKQTDNTCNPRCTQAKPSCWSHRNSGRNETSNLGHTLKEKTSACIKKCVTCFRFTSGSTHQLMGDLLRLPNLLSIV